MILYEDPSANPPYSFPVVKFVKSHMGGLYIVNSQEAMAFFCKFKCEFVNGVFIIPYSRGILLTFNPAVYQKSAGYIQIDFYLSTFPDASFASYDRIEKSLVYAPFS